MNTRRAAAPATCTSPSGTIEVTVLIEGRPQPFYRRADGRMFVPGVPGRAYTLRVRNLASVRAEIIATVDGRHVLKDEPGDPYACRGLVIPAYGGYEFRGWRVSDDESREFLFGDPAASVAVQATGSTENTGVIGFAAWQEQQPYYSLRYNTVSSYNGGFQARSAVSTAMTSPAAASAAGMAALDVAHGSIGTGIGACQDDRVGRTGFTRTEEPDILAVGYDTEAELIRRGIIGPADPDPFPGTQTGYARYVTA